MEHNLHEVDIHQRLQFALQVFHPALVHLVEVVVILKVVRDEDVARIGGVENFGLVEKPGHLFAVFGVAR